MPVLPGSARFSPGDSAGLAAAGAAAGYPLLVKAAAGGGGIGMRRVDDAAALESVAAATQALAERGFGDGTVYLERLVAPARHVEVQVFGFGDGEAIHLFERDCSIQRRFQKVVEEAPAPALPEAARRAMAEAALTLARAVRYRGAGTVEFVAGPDGEFFFLEMNTRIQVEHPVTEMLTGIDLVASQLRLARGEPLDDLRRGAAAPTGHAIECRLYAERPARRFLPAPGRIAALRWPPAHPDLRIDTGVREGDAVTPHYDPLIAKLVARGESRGAALRRMEGALAEHADRRPVDQPRLPPPARGASAVPRRRRRDRLRGNASRRTGGVAAAPAIFPPRLPGGEGEPQAEDSPASPPPRP